ncbi:hypothetical protein [Streptomyces sp. NPDC088258]|uniref:hypothetical protein n=1 Tax=Streptomyces sp. NPDC088258 TaxID=3365849 RepID=UPI00381742E1
MKHLTRVTAFAPAVALLVALTAGCGAGGDTGDGAREKPGEPAATATSVALPAPRSAPEPAAEVAAPARSGEVRIEPGPFTDRVRITGLKLTGGSAVTGRLTITTDVSHVLALEVRAAYYDDAGRLLGTGSFEYQEEGGEGGHAHADAAHEGSHAGGEGIGFTVPAKKLTGTPAAAVISVPVLVNE